MKIHSLFKATAVLLASGIGLSSCLKDDAGFLDVYEGKNAQPIVEFFGDQNATFGLTLQREAQDISFTLNVASPNVPDKDMSVTVAVDPAVLSAYNNAEIARAEEARLKKEADSVAVVYELLPDTLYTIPSPTVVVKAGQRETVFTVSVVKADLIFQSEKSFALPLTITDAQGTRISGNFKSLLIPLVVNNIYAGEYHSTGLFNHPTAGPRDIDRDKTLATINANTCETEYADLGGNGWKMWLVVNPDNTVTIIPKGAANTATVPNGDNVYDPVAKSFSLHYKYNGRIIDEVIKKK